MPAAASRSAVSFAARPNTLCVSPRRRRANAGLLRHDRGDPEFAYRCRRKAYHGRGGRYRRGRVSREIAAAGVTHHELPEPLVFQDDGGRWHAVFAIGVHSTVLPDHWPVLVHAVLFTTIPLPPYNSM